MNANDWKASYWRYIPSAATIFAPESARAKTGAIISENDICICSDICEEAGRVITDEHNRASDPEARALEAAWRGSPRDWRPGRTAGLPRPGGLESPGSTGAFAPG